jgi:uncharacterized protein
MFRTVSLEQVFGHQTTQKYLSRSGISHAVATSFHAYKLSKRYGVNPDFATKAALLHDIGHYTWYTNGEWDYHLYKENDIHAIKGAERAHKLLLRLGEEPKVAKEVALAILLHTDSYLPSQNIKRTPLQEIVHLADEADEQPKGGHHYREMNLQDAFKQIKRLDKLVERSLKDGTNIKINHIV